MEIALGIVFIAAGVLLPIGAYFDKVGQIGSGPEPALRRRRLLTRGRMFVMAPVFVIIGIVLLRAAFSG